MLQNRADPLHVVVVGVDLDPLGSLPADPLPVWRDFGRLEAAAAEDGRLRVSLVQASWHDDRRKILGLDCHFVKEPTPLLKLPGLRPLRRLPRRLIDRVKSLEPDVVHFNGLTFPRDLRALPCRRSPSSPRTMAFTSRGRSGGRTTAGDWARCTR